jgi:hypothetical protein
LVIGLLHRSIVFAADCANADAEVAALQPGGIVMLENTRFYKEEEGKVKKTDEMTEEEYKEKKAALKEKLKNSRTKNRFEALVSRSEGRPVLVPAEDKRPALPAPGDIMPDESEDI